MENTRGFIHEKNEKYYHLSIDKYLRQYSQSLKKVYTNDFFLIRQTWQANKVHAFVYNTVYDKRERETIAAL